jgi:hypothetical protein
LLKDLKKDLNDELAYITDVISDHPKNYQVWYGSCQSLCCVLVIVEMVAGIIDESWLIG